MTKLKNTKKGMAKKALSISLVAAMLATSNVPVWAAEDLFSDSVAVETEAPIAEENSTDAEVFSAEAAPVAEDIETVAPMASNEAVTVDVKIKENGWGYDATIDPDHSSITGLTSNETNVMYYWTVDGKQVTTPTQVATSDLSRLKYNPPKEYCNDPLALVIYRPETWSNAFTWTSESAVISKRDINKKNMTNIALTSKTVTYDGKEHKDASDWINTITFGVNREELTYEHGDFNVTVTGDKGLVNVDSEITISVQPKDTEFYTGEYVKTLTTGIVPKAYEAGDIKVEYVGPKHVYNGAAVTLKKSDFKVTDALSGEVMDSEKVIYSISNNSATNAGEYSSTIGLVEDGSANYKTLNNVSVASSNKWKIEKLNLADSEIFLGALPANDKGDAVTVADLVNVASIKNAEGKQVAANVSLASLGLKLSSVQANSGTPGTYSATVESISTSTNYTGKTDSATFRVYANGLGGAAFDGKVSGTNTIYATADEEFTGEAVTKDVEKLGKLVLKGTNLTAGIDYDANFAYKNNTNAGKAEFVVKGLNTYAGSELTFQFEIKKATVASKDVKAAEKVTFEEAITDAKDYAPTLTVVGKNGATPAKEFALEKDKDYTVKYSFASKSGPTYSDVTSNGNTVGNYVHSKITITNNNFKGGTTTFDVYSQIAKPQVSDWTVSTVNPSYTYTGEAIIPELIVKDGTKELENGIDYEVRSIARATDVGTATVTLAGKGDYDSSSTITTTFEITPANTSDLVVSVDDMEYTGQRIRPDANNIKSVKLGGKEISLSVFTISYPDSKDANKEIGTGTFTLAPKATNKNFTGSKEVTFNIVGKKITTNASALKVYDANGKEADLTAARIYDGTAQTFAKTEFNYIYTDPVTHKSVTLEEGKDFEIKYFHNVYGEKQKDDAASGTAYIAVVGKGSYAGNGKDFVFEDENGKKVNAITFKTFNINSVKLTDQNVKVSNGVYAEGMPVKPVITVTYGKDTLTLEEGKDYKLDIVGVYTEPTTTKKYTVTVSGINGYTGKTTSKSWGIDKKDLADCNATAYRNDSGNLVVTVMNGSVVVDSSKYVVTENTANNTVTITPAADSKYYTNSLTVDIEGKDVTERPVAPTIQQVNVVGNKATVVLAGDTEGSTGYDYVISKSKVFSDKASRVGVNANVLSTQTTFRYVDQGVYYAYLHSWKRGADGKKIFSEWSNAYPFSVSAITPEQPTVTSVKVSGKTVKVTYTKTSNATGYDLVLGSKVKKVYGEKRPVEYGKLVKKVYNGNTVTATFTNVPKGTYYAGLHAYNRTSENNGKVFSPWSNTKKVVVK